MIERSTLVPANFAGSGYLRVGRGTEQDRKISSDARHSRQKPTLSQTALAARSEAERRARREAKGPPRSQPGRLIVSGPAHQNVSNEPLRLAPRERLAHGARTAENGEQARNRQAGRNSF